MSYLIPIKICAPLNFEPLIFAPLIFAHPQILHPFNFCSPLFYCKFAVFSLICPFFHSFVTFFLLPLIFALSYCPNLLPLSFAQARCANIKGAQIQWKIWTLPSSYDMISANHFGPGPSSQLNQNKIMLIAAHINEGRIGQAPMVTFYMKILIVKDSIVIQIYILSKPFSINISM